VIKNEGMSPQDIRSANSDRHISVVSLLQFLADSHLHPELQNVVTPIRNLAFDLIDQMKDGPELTVALRKLVEAKDSFCRQYLVDHDFNLTPQTRKK
jgi:hypothetical protein